jgi:phosphoglycolate/pyridoxal phosphate phosphatase family enzyme
MNSQQYLVELNRQNVKEFLLRFDTFLIDCDGVLWRGKEVVPNAPQTLDFLRSLGKRLIFVTNNSTKSRLDYKKIIESYGIKVDRDEIFSSSYAVAKYLESINFQKKVYIVGENGIGQELDEVGIRWCGAEEDAKIPQNVTELQETLRIDPEIGAVIAGLDTKLTYFKLCYALLHLRQGKEKCYFIASNSDATLPVANNLLLPGGGAVVEALAVASQRRPDIICGKPESFFLNLILNTCNIQRSRAVIIGDRLETDIAFGLRGNINTLLVLTGVSTTEQIQATHYSIRPNYITNSISDILSLAHTN